ncbi:condensation domain-containing protein [Planotetraspora sp. A-T 1434]|uniref:condensation domain-containing protein n=1 Tax=Planotetraspora sp. A-T 1434 TaxID=2979219 RepID=UPI0021C0026E|nr:condensation domain-containing protein [Planotetraspora sp. A-T 1434]MCT9933173.1 condensation domain-containing protein [Planotetraspora sp. A-T 1434]
MSVSEATDLLGDIPNGGLDRIPLSANQQFLCAFDRGDEEGPFGPRYTIVCGWRVTGSIDPAVLQEALDDVVARHEALRTEVVRGEGGGYQRVVPPSPASLTVRDLSGVAAGDRDRAAEELLNDVEAEPFPLRDLPLVRAVLGRFDERDGVLALMAHHVAADEWSMRLIMRDVVHRYAVRTGHDLPDLSEVLQYRDYVDWERSGVDPAVVSRSESYWREKLSGARMLTIRTDHPHSAGLPKATAWQRFRLPGDLTAAVLRIGKETHSSPFMVLLAAYAAFLRDRAQTTDIVIPTFSSGRGQARFHNAVGSFFNFMPLRLDLAGSATFRDVVVQTRTSCVKAYAHDMPFGLVLQQAPELMLPAMEDDMALVAFQVFRSPFADERDTVGDLEYAVIRRRLLSQPVGGDVPDGAMWHLEIDRNGELVGSMAYNTNLFDDDTISDMVSGFGEALRRVITDPDVPLRTA